MTVDAASVAQTNLQLYAQLRRAGWTATSIEAVGRAYGLAAELFTGQYRASGKAAIDHFVGVASAVAIGGSRPALVRAALLHNAYRQGCWADGFARRTPRRRREVAAAIGQEAESVVAAYPQFEWTDRSVRAATADPPAPGSTDHDLVILRLADEIDHRLDGGHQHSHQSCRDPRLVLELAERLDAHALARLLEQVGADPVVEPGLVRDAHGAQLTEPRTHRRSTRARLGATHRSLRRKLGPLARRVAPRLAAREGR